MSWLELKAWELSRKEWRRKTLRRCKTWCWDKFRAFLRTEHAKISRTEASKGSHATKSGFNDESESQIINLHCDRALTFLPAWLLCKFISLRASPSISLMSRNFRANLMPKSMSTEQPPHFHDCERERSENWKTRETDERIRKQTVMLLKLGLVCELRNVSLYAKHLNVLKSLT